MGDNDQHDPFPKSDQIGPNLDAVLDAEKRALPRYARQQPPWRRPQRVNGHKAKAPWDPPQQSAHTALCEELLADPLLKPHLTDWDVGFLASVADFSVLSEKQEALLEKYQRRRDRLRLAFAEEGGSWQ
jgi:hypothetical protein